MKYSIYDSQIKKGVTYQAIQLRQRLQGVGRPRVGDIPELDASLSPGVSISGTVVKGQRDCADDFPVRQRCHLSRPAWDARPN